MDKTQKITMINCFVPLDRPIVISEISKGYFGYKHYQTNLELQDENRVLKKIIEMNNFDKIEEE